MRVLTPSSVARDDGRRSPRILARLRAEASAAGDIETERRVNAILGEDATGFTVHATAAGRARTARTLADADWVEGSAVPGAIARLQI